MIVAVGSDKGSPGATTLATVLGLVWPGERVLCELDPRGADLPFRLMGPDGRHMPAVPSIVTLAVDARPGGAPVPVERYAQPTLLGVPVIRGEVSTRATSKVAAHLPAITAVSAAWRGTVIADLGSLQPGNAALVAAKAAVTVLLVMRASTEGLGHLRARIEELSEYVGDPRRDRTPVGVVLVTGSRAGPAAIRRTRTLLDKIGSPAPVVGVFADDPAGAAALWTSRGSRKVARSRLVRSAEALVREMWRLWPDLDAGGQQRPPAAPAAATVLSSSKQGVVR